MLLSSCDDVTAFNRTELTPLATGGGGARQFISYEDRFAERTLALRKKIFYRIREPLGIPHIAPSAGAKNNDT